MNYADFKQFDTLNGLGIRHSLFVSGCSHRCPGCFNAAAWNSCYGHLFTNDVKERIFHAFATAPVPIRGLSLLGGEPFENVDGLLPFVQEFRMKFPTMDVWCWSGYTFEQLLDKSKNDTEISLFLKKIDILIDGRFVQEEKDLRLRFRGSRNQRIIDVQASIQRGTVVERADLYECA